MSVRPGPPAVGGKERRPAPAGGGALAAGHSPGFVAAWRSVFCDVYRWRRDGRFAVVPQLFRAPVLAYLPGLNYADLDAAEARALARETAGRPFNVRALAAAEGEPPPGAPAVLRIDLAAFGHDRDAVWERALNSATRRAVRRARKAGLAVAEEAGPGAAQAFRSLLSATLARHGAPMMPAVLFDALIDRLDARILVVRERGGGEALASLLWLQDGPLAWMPWLGSRRRADRPGNLLLWGLVEHALRAGADIVDFGRSPAGGGVYRFKRGFGAVPVPVLWLSSSDREAGPYRRYATARRVWRALPGAVADGIGPRLCRYLAEY